MTNFFDITNNVCSSHEDIWDDAVEKAYLPFMVNRSISQHMDTLMYANEMNTRMNLTTRQQYLFYLTSIKPKKKRFSKWAKPDKDDAVQVISTYYKCNIMLAEQYASIISADDVQQMREKMSKGGQQK